MSEPMQAQAADDKKPEYVTIKYITVIQVNPALAPQEPQTAQEAIHEALEAPLPTWNEIKAGREAGMDVTDEKGVKYHLNADEMGRLAMCANHPLSAAIKAIRSKTAADDLSTWTTAALLEEEMLLASGHLPDWDWISLPKPWWHSLLLSRYNAVSAELKKRCLARLEQLRDDGKV